MRPRFLEIEGLQSFKEQQRIDFDKLSETGLFGIFGPTGSGKSTILDSITLALYGNVLRAAKGTQGIINTDMAGIKVAFTFDLTKEGIRKTYRVERQYKRKKDSDSSAEVKLVRLLEVAGEQEYILADKHSDVNLLIVQLVGLKFEDFTRSVVLPQNKFQEFLLSPRGEKTKMLERIFYLEEYGKQLGDKVNRQMSAVKYKLSNIEGALSSLGISSPEALIESERKMEEAQAYRAACTNKRKAAEQDYEKGMELYKLSREHEEINKKLLTYKSRETEIQGLQEKLRRGEAANHIKPIITAYKEAKTGYVDTEKSLKALQETLAISEADMLTAQERYNTALLLKDQRLPELIRYKTILQECQALQQEMEALDKQLNAARKEYEEIRIHMETAKKTVAEKTQQKDALTQEVLRLEQKAEEQRVDNEERKQVSLGLELEKELQKLEVNLYKQNEKYAALQKDLVECQDRYDKSFADLSKGMENLEKLKAAKDILEGSRPADREEIAKQQGKLISIEGMLQNMISSLGHLRNMEAKIKDYHKQEDALKLELEGVDQSLRHALTERDQKLQLLKQLQEQQKQHAAVLLSNGLVEGEACPVCGSLEHPKPAATASGYQDEELEHKQKEVQLAIEMEQLKIRELEHQHVKLNQLLSSLQHMMEQVVEEHQSKHAEYQNYIAALPEMIRTLEPEELTVYILKEKDALTIAAQEYMNWEKKLQQLLEEVKQQEGVVAETKIQESKLTVSLEGLKAALQLEQGQLEEQQRSYEAMAQKHQEMKLLMKVSSFSQETEKISEKDEQAQKLAPVVKERREKRDALTNEIQIVLEKVNEISNELTTKAIEGKKLREQKDEKEKKLLSTVGDKNIGLELEQAEKEETGIEASCKSNMEALNGARQTLEELRRRKAALQSSFEHFKEKLHTEDYRLQQGLSSKGFINPEDAEAALLSVEAAGLYQEELTRHQREKGSLEDRLQNIAKQLNGQLLQEEEWQQICSDYEGIKREMETSISLQEAAKNSYMQIKDSFEKWLKLQTELKNISRKKDMLEQIQRLLKGNAFIEFISEERMRYIAREASETLGELTKFRYSIELDSENGFVIRDNANGGVLRSVASLSGGETFLTSLSLALALSSQLQLKGQSPLEFFFLDEGFGTLDNTLLDTVIDSLERLSSSKRIIGLISHVPEMKNRIMRRLIIDAPDRTGKGSRITIEKA